VTAPKLKRGDRVRVRRDSGDEWCEGAVVLVSENGKSVGLLLAGMVRAGSGYAGGTLPLLIDFEAETVSGVLTSDEYEIELTDAQS
jgi:hypothetical protein